MQSFDKLRFLTMQSFDKLRFQFLAVLHFLIGITALLGGGALVVWADGRMLQMSVKLLAGSPFSDFLLPGVILYGAVGVHNLIACFVVAKREQGAEVISFFAGATLLIWLVAESTFVGASHWLQLGYGALALLVVADAIWIRRTREVAPATVPQLAH
jgi:hypothetical protein